MSLGDILRQVIFRFKKPRSLADALLVCFPQREVKQIVHEVATTDLIDAVSQALLVETDEIVKRVAEILGVGPARTVEVPSAECISMSGYDVAMLKSLVALPQRSRVSRMGFALVVADPTIIDPNEFYERGIPVLLSCGSTITDAWAKYEWEKSHPGLSQVSEAQAFAVLRQLAEDAHACGAAEVFIGHPEADGYEFLVGAEKYCGKLHPYIYPLLLTQFRDVFKLDKEIRDSQKLVSLSLSLTRNFEHPVLCLTWEPVPSVSSSRPEEILMGTTPKVEGSATETQPEPAAVQITELSASTDNQPGFPETRVEKRRKALLLDDDERFLTILSRILVSKGWDVERFTNAQVALDLFHEKQLSPDLVVSDVHMPHMDGGSFLKQFKSLGIETPVLMLTSDDDKLLEAELAMLGADAFVRKQEDPRILLAWCNNLVQRHVRAQTATTISH